MGELIIYKNSDSAIEVEVQYEDNTLWLNLNQISQLFEKDKSVISRHIRNIFKDDELDENSTVAKNATVQQEGNRKVSREIVFYNLDVILAVGYRVSSKKGTLFRKWATEKLNDYLVKGYAINEKRLLQQQKQIDYLKTNETDYWIELLYQSKYLKEEQYKSINYVIQELSKILALIIITTKKNYKS